MDFLFEFSAFRLQNGHMNDSVIPQDARQFLLKNIETIAQLEGLLLLRADPGSAWDAPAVARNLYIDEPEAAQVLERLAARGMLSVDGSRYAYAPANPDIAAMIDQIAGLYGRYLIAITHVIHSRPKSRVQEFANAFRIRKD